MGFIKLLLKVVTIVFVILVLSSHMVKANDSEMIKGYSTAYCLKGITSSGEMTHEGICASAKRYLGKTIQIYQRLPDNSIGKYLGSFECKDTGNAKGLKNGRCVDVWMPNRSECQKWMNLVYSDGCKGKIYFKIIEK